MEEWKLDAYRLHAKLSNYKRLVDQAETIIKDILKNVSKPYISFSCGKDSSALAHMVLQRAPAAPLRFLSSGETRLIHDVDTILDYFKRSGAAIEEINIDRVFTEEWKDASWTEQRKAGNKDLEVLNAGDYDCLFMGLRIQESRIRAMSLAMHQDKDLPRFCHKYLTGSRQDMIRCCPLANWGTEDVGAYIVTNKLPWLSWYDYKGFEGRTTARLTGDAVRQNVLLWIKYYKPDQYQILAERFPEFRLYV